MLLGTIPTNWDLFLDYGQHIPTWAVDSESDPNTGMILGISVAFLNQGMYFPINHLESEANISDEIYDRLLSLLSDRQLLVMHNKAHDLEVFRTELELNLWEHPVACTMIMAHMVDENVPSKSLDYLHKHYTGKEGKNRSVLMQSFIDSMGWLYVPVVLMAEYAANDAIITEELFNVLLPLFEKQYGPLYEPF